MEANEILKKAMTIITKAENSSSDFHSNYTDNLRATGGSSADYSLYEIDLSENYYLIIDFVDFSLADFSIVNRGLDQHIAQNVEAEVEQQNES